MISPNCDNMHSYICYWFMQLVYKNLADCTESVFMCKHTMHNINKALKHCYCIKDEILPSAVINNKVAFGDFDGHW